ncbi:MAG: peptide-methionine (S)-S-oxide reductase MsrA [Ilumatobacter sp.]|uniref:peptide-methionine (S)-S-oxide reductase MsrA n=1 Tax=Ilumatobacter sp. TaxID=1967498 RepID=UPI0039197A85
MNRRIAAPPPPAENCLPGRSEPRTVPDVHHVNGNPLVGPWPDGLDTLVVAMGCFWGAERLFWKTPGVYSTAVGYAGGTTPNPTYEETCTSMTGHTEAVLVVFDPNEVTVEQLLAVFWENHDPVQYMGQGNDIGSQYRSAIYTNSDDQAAVVAASRDAYQERLSTAGFGEITTEIAPAAEFFYAEPYHQQYLAKNPGGYCNHGFCQVAYA